MKRWLSVFLIAAMIITLLPQSSIMAKADSTIDGSDENDAEWLSLIVPTVTVKESYDTHLTLTLSVPEDMEVPDDVNLYYAVTVTTHKSDLEEAIEQTFYFAKEPADSQEVIIRMNQGLIANGEKWTYDIAVQLVHTGNVQIASMDEVEKAIVGTSYITNSTGVSVASYYESNLTLKKGTTTIYTTQKGVAVATVIFSKNTTVKDNLKVEDITYSEDDNKQYALEFEQIGTDLVVRANADEDTALGKHTIKVTAAAAENMYASEAVITVNVVQGIEDGMISVFTPADQLYKTENKATSLTFKAEYEKDIDTDKLPNKKKVTWEILAADGTVLDERDSLYGMISVKNGTVTVKKNYVVSTNSNDNCFMVKATAADFEGNTVSAYSQVVEIVSQVEAFGEVAIVKIDDLGNAIVTARSGETITSDKLGYVRVFKADAPVRESYTSEEMDQWTFPSRYLTYKSGNGAVKIAKDGLVTASKPAKNVKITATANDKSKRKAELEKLTIAYEQPLEIALKVEAVNQDGTGQQVGKILSDSTTINVNTTADSAYMLTVMQRNSINDAWEEVDSYVNFSISVKNGKIIKKSGDSKQYYLVNTTKETFTIKFTDKAQKKTITYTIFNTAFPKGITPKISTKDKLKALSYAGEQTITYTLKEKYGNVVLITTDNVEKYKSDANAARYSAFENVVSGIGYQTVGDDGTIKLHFTTDEANPLPAGSYKLWFTFGAMDSAGNFRASTAAKAVTLKAQKVNTGKGTYTPVTGYNMAVKEGGTVTLTGKGNKYLADTVEFSNLRNSNVGGAANAFRTYYELVGNTLKLKDNLTDEQLDYISSSKAKNDWAAHVDYKVSLANTDGSYSEKTGTVKIRITMKDSVRNFTFSSVKVPDAETVAYVTAYANNKAVNVLHAYATSGSYEAEHIGNSSLALIPKTGSSKPKGGANKVTIYVVPEGTYEANKVKLDALKAAWDNADSQTEASAREAYAAAMKKYGIKATATVTIPTKDVANRDLCEEVVRIVNKERQAAGLQPVSINESVMEASAIRSKEIVESFAHTRPDGRSCFTVLDECGISYRGAGENIAYGYETPEMVMDAWMNSPGHRANIMNGKYTEMGVGCYESGGRLYWVQLFIYQ